MSVENGSFNSGPEVGDTQPSLSKGSGQLQRLKLNAGLLASAYLTMPRELTPQEQLEEDILMGKVVRTEIEEGTGTVTEVLADGSRRVVEPYLHAETPLQAPATVYPEVPNANPGSEELK